MLLGKWTPIKLANESKPLVYQIFHHLLNASDEVNDQVVRVTAARQLANVAAAWEFDSKPMLPFLDDILTRLMALIQEVEYQDTKMALLNTISILAERMEQHVCGILNFHVVPLRYPSNMLRSPHMQNALSICCRRYGSRLERNT
jgi:hypothetical protein